MASFYSEKSLVRKKRRKASSVQRSRVLREKREEERLRKELAEKLKKKIYDASVCITSIFRKLASNKKLSAKLLEQVSVNLTKDVSSINALETLKCFRWHLKLQNFHPGELDFPCSAKPIFVKLCKALISSDFFQGNEKYVRYTLSVTMWLIQSCVKGSMRDVACLRTMITVLSASTYDLPIPKYTLLSNANSTFVASYKNNAGKFVFFELIKVIMLEADLANELGVATVKCITNILKIAIDSILTDNQYKWHCESNNMLSRKKEVLQNFFVIIYFQKAVCSALTEYNSGLARVFEKKEFYTSVIEMVGSPTVHQNCFDLTKLSPTAALQAVDTMFLLQRQKFNDDCSIQTSFLKAAGHLILRIPIDYFYESKDDLPSFYSDKNIESGYQSEYSHGSYFHLTNIEDEFDDDWSNVGNVDALVSYIMVEMRKLILDTTEHSEGKPRSHPQKIRNWDSHFINEYIKNDQYIRDFESLVLNGENDRLAGCKLVCNIIVRWCTPYIFFPGEETNEQAFGKGNASGIKRTGAPLQDLITHFKTLDSEIVSLVYYGQGKRNMELSISALNEMTGETQNNSESIVDGVFKVNNDLIKRIPSKGLQNLLSYLTNGFKHSAETTSRDGKKIPPFLHLWHVLNTKYNVDVTLGNNDVARTIPGLSEAVYVFITCLFLVIKSQSDEEFHRLQYPFQLGTDLSKIVTMLQLLMSRLSSIQNNGQISDISHSYDQVFNAVLYLGSLRLFNHLVDRHKRKSWIRNTSSLSSELLQAVEIDRNIMKEQDEAFQAALDTDQSIAHAVSSNEIQKNVESENSDGKASTTELTVEHSKDQQKIDRERRAAFYERKFGKK